MDEPAGGKTPITAFCPGCGHGRLIYVRDPKVHIVTLICSECRGTEREPKTEC